MVNDKQSGGVGAPLYFEQARVVPAHISASPVVQAICQSRCVEASARSAAS
jgi:hypothetical protein